MSSKRYVAQILGMGTNPYYASPDTHQSKPESTALASQYSNPLHTNNNASQDRSAAWWGRLWSVGQDNGWWIPSWRVGDSVIVNLIGLLAQSVFYYVCKSYHHQGIDKSALYDHLGGYLGEYVPLKSRIQMENLEA